VLSGRGLCDELITRPENSYRLWCVIVCDPETSSMRRPWLTGGCPPSQKNTRTLCRIILRRYYMFPLYLTRLGVVFSI